jgi:hypothetical protein
MKKTFYILVSLFFAVVVVARDYDKHSDLQGGSVILVIRHAEKPETGWDLSAAGQEHARKYVSYFKEFKADGQSLKIDRVFAAADSKVSHRPRLTVEPTAKALGLAVDSRFKTEEVQALANEIRPQARGHVILIAWHHGQIPALLRALGADPQTVLTKGKWPESEFSWVIELRYDSQGRLVKTKRITEEFSQETPDASGR